MDVEIKKEAISYHYDVGNNFYQHWLDSEMVYSCAMWDDDDISLETAQLNKLDWHLDNLGISNGNILDVGCGWGALLRRHISKGAMNAGLGLTLSEAQKEYVKVNDPDINILVESWTEHDEHNSYDGIVSIGAFEHFANRKLTRTEKNDLYTAFFSKCNRWLGAGGVLSLQTIVYGTMTSEEQNLWFSDQVFPDSELPTVEEIEKASADFFELKELRLDGKQYAKTCDIWLERLRADKLTIIDSYGVEKYEHYVKYLKFCVVGFYSGKLDLSRFVLVSKGLEV